MLYARGMETQGEMTSAVDVAYNWLRRMVQSIPPDQSAAIAETDVAAAAAVSRTPVREALIRLTAEGLVERAPTKGLYVPRLDAAMIDSIFESRHMLEVHAATIALGHAGVVDEMRRILVMQEEATGDPESFLDLDVRFHTIPVRAAGNRLNLNFYRSLRDRQLRLGHAALNNDPVRAQAVLDEHRAIVDAYALQDVEAVTQAVRAHIDTTTHAVRHSLTSMMLD